MRFWTGPVYPEIHEIHRLTMSLNNVIKSVSEGDFINQPFEANVSYPETKEHQGRNFYVAKLTDGGTTVRVSGGVDFAPFDGQRVSVTTPYKKPKAFVKWKETYNGTPKLSIGEGAVLTPAGSAQPAQQPSPAAPPPAASQGSGGHPGVTVGMAINKAVDICIASGLTDAPTVYQVASTLVRMAEKMQAGILAPKEETPAAPPAPPPPQEPEEDDFPF